MVRLNGGNFLDLEKYQKMSIKRIIAMAETLNQYNKEQKDLMNG